MKKYSGLFIAFEGLDGSGEEIQASLLYGLLKQKGYNSYLTREPTDHLIGGLIKGALVGEWSTDARALQLLFAADRANHLAKEIEPKLETGKIVITDRYAFSSIAFGSTSIGDTNWLEGINSQFIMPDLVFLIKVRPKICAARLKQSRYDLELFKKEEQLAKVEEAYAKLALKHKNIYVIDGEREEAEILGEIAAIVEKALKEKN